MIIVQICVGSSCHLKGSRSVIELFKEAVEKYKIGESVALAGSFCMGMCSGDGVCVTVDDKRFSVTPAGFDAFFQSEILSRVN